ncbi:uncharacterized protein A4U43_C05F2720 [Asparagus officinalis]|uniref:ubiquitinyl hydrolase 1 n=1 Tax=Asparagus officinalis TaxID=4686 RepID=A0A5P1EUC2_ASPOF|nr:ataxin-3 homolog [Asparagus officinalis]ONK67690.1 uncharacterized protein A4U43_C05F2720 [Asparagus officinalis]
MESPSNGGMLYHEVQESKLCAVHCVNTVLQGPFFSEVDLAALASDLDRSERQVMSQGGGSSGDFLMEDSHNVSMGGDFSIQVLEKALGVWDLQVIPFNSPAAEASNCDPELESAFICHLHDHWFCIRRVNGEWYNFNSLYAAPEHLSKFYLSAFLDTLRGSGWSIFMVRGNFPKDCPLQSSNAFGQWLTPDDAQRITKSCNERQALPQGQDPSQFMNDADALAAQEEEDLNAAIAASLMDSSNFTSASSPAVGSQTKEGADAATAASLLGSAFSIPTSPSMSSNLAGSQSTANESSSTDPQSNANESGSSDPRPDQNTTSEPTTTISSDAAELHETETTRDDKDQ